MFSPRIRFLALLIVTAISVPASGDEEFRVRTMIFVGDDESPVAETLTLFDDGVVYDFLLTEPQETFVFDNKRGRLMLLDPQRRVRATVLADQLREFTSAMQKYEKQGPLAFFLKPTFDAEFDKQTGWFTLSSEQLTYRVQGIEPKFPGATERYRRFADWCARFNSIRPGNLPPFARIELNRAVAERGWIPAKVERSIRIAGRSGGKQLVRTEHEAVWRMSDTDRKRIAETSRFLASFTAVGLHEYQQAVMAEQPGDGQTR
jgi:hypothetical protein